MTERESPFDVGTDAPDGVTEIPVVHVTPTASTSTTVEAEVWDTETEGDYVSVDTRTILTHPDELRDLIDDLEAAYEWLDEFEDYYDPEGDE